MQKTIVNQGTQEAAATGPQKQHSLPKYREALRNVTIHSRLVYPYHLFQAHVAAADARSAQVCGDWLVLAFVETLGSLPI